jgi:hypothetical protein
LREELHPKGVEVVTVALDTGGSDAARPWIEKAQPQHPALIDQAHVTGELFGFVNVPNAVWIDENQTLVRPAHAAHIKRSPLRDMDVPDGLGRLGDQLLEVKKIRTDPDAYVEAIRDWADHGEQSAHALTPDQVIARSRPRPPEHAEAAAAFELAQHLWRTDEREAWTFATTKEGEPSDLIQGPNDLFEGNWLDDVKAAGAENYYEPWT